VTLDLSLPGMDGIATLCKLRELADQVPVIMLSGVADTRAIAHAVKHGATDFLRKPFEPQELKPPSRASAAAGAFSATRRECVRGRAGRCASSRT
jgi:DNA-binding response OmpR family regulator